jgi:hypothetical protein
VIVGRLRRKTVLLKQVVIGRKRPGGNACAPMTSGNAPGGTGSSGTSGGSSKGTEKQSSGSGHASGIGEPRQAGVLGANASKILPGSGGTQLALLAVLAAAIFLLSLGALPRGMIPHPGAAALLVRRRGLVAAAGFAALAAFAVSYFLG